MPRMTKPKGKRKQRVRKIVTKYTVLIERDEETGQYCVSVPALPGCFTYGDTLEEAITNAEECIRGFLEASQKVGLPIPIEIELPVEALVIDE
ncbi:MAG: hypothetical protein LKKZDAJK_001421 [Candidatus Fervidibacter sp.]